MKELEPIAPAFTARALIAAALARSGKTQAARASLRDLERDAKTAGDAVTLAAVYVSLGERTRAFDALERAYAGKLTWFPLINVDERFDEIHDDPRFQDLLRRIGIPR